MDMNVNVGVTMCVGVCVWWGEVIVYFLGNGIFMIIMTDLICGWIWVNLTYISWGVALRCLPPKMSPFILRCFRDLFVSFYS